MKFGAISEPEFAINQTWVKIHVSNGYHKRFWTMLRYDPIQWKNHASIVVMSLQISHGKYTLFSANFFVGLRAYIESLKLGKKFRIGERKV